MCDVLYNIIYSAKLSVGRIKHKNSYYLITLSCYENGLIIFVKAWLTWLKAHQANGIYQQTNMKHFLLYHKGITNILESYARHC